MNLGVCVVKSVLGNRRATIQSVKNLPIDFNIHLVDNFIALKQHFLISKEDWTLVLYEREFLDARFNDAFVVMLNEKTVSAYSFCCVIKTNCDPLIIDSVRLFKKGVFLKNDALRPSMPDSSVVKILDGWIYEHGTEKDIYTNNRNGENFK